MNPIAPKEIALNRGYTALVDEADFDRLASRRWSVLRTGRKRYAITSLRNEGKAATILMHRMILSPPRDLVVDHIDGDGLNNTRNNLRVCTSGQNIFAQHRVCIAANGYRGVSERDGRFLAKVTKEKTLYLGTYATAIEAAFAHYIGCTKVDPEFSPAARLSEFSDIPLIKRSFISSKVLKILSD